MTLPTKITVIGARSATLQDRNDRLTIMRGCHLEGDRAKALQTFLLNPIITDIDVAKKDTG